MVICAGAWVQKHWQWLGKPTLDLVYPDGSTALAQDMWTFWRLLEGRGPARRHALSTADDRDPPVLHVELMNTPVVTEAGHRFLTCTSTPICATPPSGSGAPRHPGRHHPDQDRPRGGARPYGHARPFLPGGRLVRRLLLRHARYLMERFRAAGGARGAAERRHPGAFTPDNDADSTGWRTMPTWSPTAITATR
ncbi:MAG: hypothetical protein R3D28_07770 [Geminicoccaceae bacterium]